MTTSKIAGCDDYNLDALLLKYGSHGETFHGEACMVEYACMLTVCKPDLARRFGKPKEFGDNHPSISPVIRSFCVSFNDGIRDDETRTRLLKPYAERILGTKTNAKDETTRAWLATDWLVRVQAPAWLDLAGRPASASALRALPPLTSGKIAIGVQSVISAARDDAAAAWAAAWDAARAAARAAARDAAWAAAWDAARDAAWDAARDAAGDAARDAAWAAARDAARDAAWAAARDAAWDAARDAARDAAWARLAPTVTRLQASVLELLDAMIAVGKKERTRAA